jgi:hypothetical protein
LDAGDFWGCQDSARPYPERDFSTELLVNLNAIRVETLTVALPAAALLITLIVLISFPMGAVTG